MMKCNNIHSQIDAIMANELNTHEADQAHAHVQQCLDCQRLFDFSSELQQRLSEMPCVVPDGFELRMMNVIDGLSRARSESTCHEDKLVTNKPASWQRRISARPLAWFASGFATAVAFCLVLGSWVFFSGQSPVVAVGMVKLAPMQTKQVSLVFHVPSDMDKATLKIVLPGDVELKGYPGKRVISWKTSLKHGTNKLVLPLTAKGAAGGNLKASVTWKGKTKVFSIGLSVTHKSSYNFYLNERAG